MRRRWWEVKIPHLWALDCDYETQSIFSKTVLGHARIALRISKNKGLDWRLLWVLTVLKASGLQGALLHSRRSSSARSSICNLKCKKKKGSVGTFQAGLKRAGSRSLKPSSTAHDQHCGTKHAKATQIATQGTQSHEGQMLLQ